MQKELSFTNGKCTLKISQDKGGKIYFEITGNPTPTQRKAVDQMRDKPVDLLTALRLLYPTFAT